MKIWCYIRSFSFAVIKYIAIEERICLGLQLQRNKGLTAITLEDMAEAGSRELTNTRKRKQTGKDNRPILVITSYSKATPP